MDFNSLVAQRYSVRAYKPDPVEEEKLRQVLEAVRLAPSACNRQPYRFLVIPTAGHEAELRRIYHRSWFHQAPLVICACGLRDEAWSRRDGQSYLFVDVAIAMDHLILAAASLGLGTCWVAAFDPVAAREILRLPDNVEPVAFTPLGYPADQPHAKERKPLEALVQHWQW
ncbi:MAG: nitroreductase [Chloroflexi bacterium]|nr:MAG: nitroreductase [Chloroflexota bacterium]